MGLHRGIATALQTMAANAKRVAEDTNRFNDGAALGMLRAFTSMVNAQRGILIPADQADALIGRARQIIELLEAMT